MYVVTNETGTLVLSARLRPRRRRRFARQAWQRLIDTVRAAQAEEVEVTKQKSLRSTPDSTSPADVRQRLLGGAGEEAAAEEGRHSLRQLPSGTAPLSFRRPSADVTWPSGSSGGASFRQLEIPAPDADQLAAAAAQLQRDLVGGGSAASSRANSEAEGLGAILDEMQGGQPADSSSAAAAPAAGPLAASAQQAAQGGARTPSPPPRSAASTPSPEGWRSALRAISNEEIDQLAEDLERMESREGPPEPDLQRAALLGQVRLRGCGCLPLHIRPSPAAAAAGACCQRQVEGLGLRTLGGEGAEHLWLARPPTCLAPPACRPGG